jgi:carbohydrate-selective porin OprB
MPLLTSCCFRGPTAREVWPFLHVSKARRLSAARSAPNWTGIVYQGPFGRDGDNVGFAIDSARVGDPLG